MDFKSLRCRTLLHRRPRYRSSPEHVWSKVSNPVTYADSNPIGTGGLHRQAVHAAEHHLRGQPDYWQPGEPKIAKVLYPAFTSNDPANTYLATGQAPVGQPVHPEHSGLLHLEVAEQPLLVPADRQRPR